MGRSHKRTSYESNFSWLLEESIEVPYSIVGYEDWLEKSIPSHLKGVFRQVRKRHEKEDLGFTLGQLWSKKIVGLDLETGGTADGDGLDPLSATSRIVLAQIGNQDRTFIVQPELLPHFKPLIESPKLLHLNQNISFDYKWLLVKYGIHIVRMYCTMLAEQLLRAGRDGFGVSLLDLARYHSCRLISKGIRTQFAHHSGIFTEDQLYYAARDVFLMFDIFASQHEEVEELGLGMVARDEFRLIPATCEMELIGVFMDEDVLKLSIDYFKRQAVILKEQIGNTWNEGLRAIGAEPIDMNSVWAILDEESAEVDEEFDIDSPQQKLEALRRVGLEVENVQRGTLKTLDHDLARLLVKYSAVQKVVSTYGDRLLRKIHPSDGRVHPRFKQLGIGDSDAGESKDKKSTIATGRYSSDFQQIPRVTDIYEKVNDPEEQEAVRRLLGKEMEAARIKMNAAIEKEAAERAAKAA
jgi:hypothetical protein